MATRNGNSPDPNPDDGQGINEEALVTYEWLDGFRTAYRQAYVDGYQSGLDTGNQLGYDEAVQRFRILIKDRYDSDLHEEFENLFG